MMIATGLLEAHHASLSLAQTRGGGEGELIVRCRGGDGSGNDVAIAAHDALLSSVCARFALWFSFFSLCLSFFFFLFISFRFLCALWTQITAVGNESRWPTHTACPPTSPAAT